jgi:drug/metabolite transporter (DMT)-like permease
LLNIIILIIGVYACSTAIIMIKISDEHPLLIAALRLLIAAIILTPLYFRILKKEKKELNLKLITPSIVPGIFLGLHFITWVIGGRLTFAANASLIVNMVPIVMPFFILFMSKEKINAFEVLGTVLGIAGITLMGISDFHISADSINGDILCFVSMLFFAFYLALARKNRGNGSVYLYIIPLYYIAGIFCFIVSLFFINPIKVYSLKNILCLIGLGVIPTVIGHSVLNKSMQTMRSQTVSIINLGQFIFAGIMAYFIFKEVPGMLFYISCVLVIAGAVTVIKFSDNQS